MVGNNSEGSVGTYLLQKGTTNRPVYSISVCEGRVATDWIRRIRGGSMTSPNFKVLQADIVDGNVYIPEKAIPIGVLFGLGDKYPVLVFLMKYDDWVEEFPDEAKKEGESKEGVSDDK